MAKRLHKNLIDYFVHLEKLDEKWLELFASAQRPLQALKNQSEQLRHVISVEVDDTELCNLKDLRERLVFKILMGIENEVNLLSNILAEFNDANQDLKNRLRKVESARSNVSLNDVEMAELINGTTSRPRLNSLLEWTIDGYKYYHELYSLINETMRTLDYKNEETIDNLEKSFTEDRFKRAKIERILAFTQFLITEKV